MPEITEAKVYQALGISAPQNDAGQGVQAQEPAETAKTQTDTIQTQTEPVATNEGNGTQEVTEPTEDVTEPSAVEQDNSDQGGITPAQEQEKGAEDPANAGKQQPLTPEQRKANAARRRQKEQQAAIDNAVADAVRKERERASTEMKDLFAKVGMKNTFTGQPITSMEEFQQWDQQYKADKLEKDLKAGKLTPEGLTQAISQNPVVQQAAEIVRQHEQEKQRQTQQADNARIEAELSEIGKMDASIQSVGDLLNMPNAKEFYAYVRKGYSFLDAYRLVNFEKLTAAKAEAAKQQALNNNRGKEHLNPVGNTRGNGAISVPSDEMALYRAFNPKATDAQIQAHYNKYKKQGG